MNLTRREFAKGPLAALGFLALPGGMFAIPAGWKPRGNPKLVFGVVSDTHIRTAWDGKSRYHLFPLKYFRTALEYFRRAKVDAVVHCGDFAHRGMAASMHFHAEEWREVFGKSRGPAKLFVTGNHDIEGWWYSEFGEGGSLGPDWVLPLGENLRDSFRLEARKAVIGNPEFPKGAKLEVSLDRINKIDKIENRGRGLRDNNPDNPVNPVIKEPAMRVKILNANGNPKSRVYAYEVVIVGENPKVKLFKCVFAEGVNLAYGREPNRGITTLKIPNDQLPAGKKLTIGVRPLSSLGTKGKSISTTFRV